ncbi:MAG: LLM class flavin-dependent oxidoreductase [Marinovum sp.]|nr:LLM class flavin-dependent oxidoreductase [Marinovum sp.]
MTQLSALIIGDESLTRECLAQWREAGHRVAALSTGKADLADWARAEGLRVEAPGTDLASRVADLEIDWVLSIANLRLLPEVLIEHAKGGAVNFHDALLPRYAGLNAPVWARIAGETRHGITWHRITPEVDGGDIIVQRSFDVVDGDTALSLNTKCYAAAIDSFGDVISALESGLPNAVVQDMSKRSYVGKFERPDAAGALRVDRGRDVALRLVQALDHGDYANPIGMAKLWTGDAFWMVRGAQPCSEVLAPGAFKRVGTDALIVGFADGALKLTGLLTPLLQEPELVEAGTLPLISDADAADWRAEAQVLGRAKTHWLSRLRGMKPAIWPGVKAQGTVEHTKLALPQLTSESLVKVAVHFAQTSCGMDACDVALLHSGQGPVAMGWVPFGAQDVLDDVLALPGFALDLLQRFPDLRELTQPDIGVSLEDAALPGAALTLTPDGLYTDSARISAEMAVLLSERLIAMAEAEAHGRELPSMGEAERALVITGWNQTETQIDATQTMVTAFATKVTAQPDATAIIVGDTKLSYAALDARANAAARALIAMGVRPGDLVGLCTARSTHLVVGALAIHKAGAAYVPMDPSYPRDRLAIFAEDSAAQVILCEAATRDSMADMDVDMLLLDGDPRVENADTAPLENIAKPEDLAYVIFTSGSTGRPKGVMVEHRNVINFFAGMDARTPTGPSDCWLALTSLSFDISVLEIFYTLSRGARVVLVSEQDRLEAAQTMAVSDQEMAFSLFYWGNDDGVGRDKYTLLLEGAKFADKNGFCAVWTPERHFHAFGGPYPNPSVTGAAVAAVTQNIGVRAGSCVAPLHHTARIAEEWSVIDNLTGGRAGMAIASGWQPDDFVLRPENTPPENKAAMLRQIEELRALWRGEEVSFPRQDGKMHAVVTQPRPVSKELPVWVTTAGNPKTWEDAGRMGANVLTHLLGQSVDEVAQKIKIYHAALRDAGHDPTDFQVTLMLHTFLADSRDAAREVAREPMKDYLRAAAALIKQYAWAFPAFKRPEGAKNAFELDLEGLSEDELDAILEFAFERYFTDSGLFGTVEDALARVEDLKNIGVTEVACLIDYGIARDTVLDGLRPLAKVVAAANAGVEIDPQDRSIAAQIRRHGVSHMQCTPSMARLLLGEPETAKALGNLRQILLGGEALPGGLVAQLADVTNASVENMYGPTETTIWSTTAAARSDQAIAPIGTPIANTEVYVVDEAGVPVPVGVEGELLIGGLGVTRGYWKRDDLTAERFIENPFGKGHLYRTGDLVRWQSDGALAYIGRADGQVKLRGHRIEMGEIEAVLMAQPGVTEAVCVVRARDQLVGYILGDAQPGAMRQALATHLPGYMVPNQVVVLDAFPLTPNQKIDRKALPDPKEIKTNLTPVATAPKPLPQVAVKPRKVVVAKPAAAPSLDMTEAVAKVWSNALSVSDIQPHDSFFDLGGHSLLAVQVHRALRSKLGADRLSIADIFGYPTLSGLVARIVQVNPGLASGTPANDAPAPTTQEVAGLGNTRADRRKNAIARRREMRARRMH